MRLYSLPVSSFFYSHRPLLGMFHTYLRSQLGSCFGSDFYHVQAKAIFFLDNQLPSLLVELLWNIWNEDMAFYGI